MNSAPGARQRLFRALAVIAVWLAITLASAHLALASPTALDNALTGGIAWSPVIAGIFLFIVVRIFKWDDLGLVWRYSSWLATLRLCTLPIIHILAMIAFLTLAAGFKPADRLMIGVVNVLAVAISEELAFRGILWGAVRKVAGFWPAFLLVCALFGAAHMGNFIVTRNIDGAVVQSIAAVMSGVGFLALRIRTGSIAPAIVLHATWDLVVVGYRGGEHGGPPPFWGMLAFSVVLVLPLFLYGLWLVRNEKARGNWRSE